MNRLSFSSKSRDLRIDMKKSLAFSNSMSLRLSPPIAQLVERRTVECNAADILRSLVQIRLGGHVYYVLDIKVEQ